MLNWWVKGKLVAVPSPYIMFTISVCLYDRHYDTTIRDMKKPDINVKRKLLDGSERCMWEKDGINPMQVKLLQHMTGQINQKIYGSKNKRESEKLPRSIREMEQRFDVDLSFDWIYNYFRKIIFIFIFLRNYPFFVVLLSK